MRKALLIALAIAACEGGTKTTESASDSATGTGTTTADTTAGDSSSTSSDASSSGPASTTAEPTTGDILCADRISELECAADLACMSLVGEPLAFPGCVPGPTFLFCNENVACDLVSTTACKGDEVYRFPTSCIPPGFTPCEPDLAPCGAVCLGLDEPSCLADPACVAYYGAPHTTQMGAPCVDFKNSVFLACDFAGPPCPPVVLTVCPEDDPATVFDVAAGCIPPGFMMCDAEPLPECP